MKIFYYHSPAEEKKYQKLYLLIKARLEQAGAAVFSPLKKVDQEAATKYNADSSLLDQVEGIVIELSNLDQEAGYLLAYAVLHKKPILCLYQDSAAINYLAKYLDFSSPPNFLFVRQYEQNNLAKIINPFLDFLAAPKEDDDIPKIKFTLRLTPKIDKYLHYKIHNTKKSKADWLRETIKTEILDKDQAYQKYLQRRTRGSEN